MFQEDGARDALVVLRRDRQNDAAPAQGQRHSLHVQVRFAGGIALPDNDTLEAVVAHDPAPQRIVQVENQSAPALPPKRAQDAAGMIGVQRQEPRIEGKLGYVPLRRGVPASEADGFGQRRHVEHDVFRAGDTLRKCRVESRS